MYCARYFLFLSFYLTVNSEQKRSFFSCDIFSRLTRIFPDNKSFVFVFVTAKS